MTISIAGAIEKPGLERDNSAWRLYCFLCAVGGDRNQGTDIPNGTICGDRNQGTDTTNGNGKSQMRN